MTGEHEVLRRLRARRERHRRRSLVVRALSAAAGFLLAAGGAVLLVPLPEAGIPLLIAALGLLALEFDWAVRALTRALRLVARVRAWFEARPAVRALAIAVAVLVVAAVVVVLVRS